MTALSERPLRKPKEYQRYFEVYEKALQPKMEFCRHKIIEQQVYWVGTPTSAARSVGAGRLLQIYGPLAQSRRPITLDLLLNKLVDEKRQL